MPYIGRELERGTYLKLDDIGSSFDGNKTIFNLTKGGDPFFPGSPQSIIVSVNGTILEPVTQYGIDSSKIVFATAPTAGHSFFSITLGLPFGVFDNGSIEDGSLTGVKLSNPFNYDDGLLFLNSLTDRVGIRTANPTHDLDIHGDVRIVGILTVGTSSLILDGSNNKIQVGTALTLSHSDGAIIGNSHLHSTGYDLKTDARIRLGDSNELQIYSGTSHNYIQSSAGRVLRIRAETLTVQNLAGSESLAKFIGDGAVELYHGMAGASAEKKIETTTTGATVTGKLVITGDLDVQGTTTTLDTTLTEVDKLEVGANNTTVGVAITQSGTGNALTIDDGNTRVFTVKDGGSVRIGDNASYTPATGAEDLVVGALTGNNNGITIITGSGNQTGSLSFADSASGNPGALFYRHTDNTMLFRVAGGTRMSIKSGGGNGKVGIGTTSAKIQLHAYNGTPSDTGGILVSNVSYASNQDKPYLIIGTKGWTGAATNWNTFGFQHKIKSDSSGVPRLTIDTSNGGTEVELFTFKNGGSLGIGVTDPQARLHLPDSGQIRLGNDSDLKIFHNGSLGVIGNVTGDLYIQSNQDGDVGGDIYIRALAGESSIYCQHDGPVFLYNNGAPKFRTYSEGVQVLGAEGGNAAILIHADEGDDNNDMYRIIAGDGTNLNFQSYATGSYVTSLRLTGDGNGAVELNHAGTKRFETTNTGVSITDNLKVAGISTFTGNIDANGNIIGDNQTAITGILRVSGSASNSMALQNVQYVGRSANRYESSFLDLNDQNVPHFGSGGNFTTLASLSGLNFIFDTNNNDNNGLVIGSGSTNTSLMATHMVVSHQGRVGIGSTIPTSKLDVIGDINTNSNLNVDGNLDVDGTANLDNVDIDGLTTIAAGAFSNNVSVGGRNLTANIDILSTSLRGGVIVRNGFDYRIDTIDGAGFMVYDPYDSSSTSFAFRAAEGATLVDNFWVKCNGTAYFADNVGIGVSNSSEKLEVVGSTTLKGDVNVGDGSADARILIKKADNNEADHIQFYNGTTRIGEIGCLDDTWLRINQETAKNIYTPRQIRADGGFLVDGNSKGINGAGNFIGGTIAGASDYDTLLRSDTGDTMNGALTVGGSSVSANEGGQINLTQAPNSTLDGTTIAIDQYIDRLRFFEQGGNNRGVGIDFTRITGGSTVNEIFSSGLTGVGFTVTNLRSFGIPNGVVAISTSTQSHTPLTVTNSGGFAADTIIAKFVGDSDALEIRNTAGGDYTIRNSQQNNGITIFDGTGGLDLNYNNSRKLTVQSGGVKLNDELTFENDGEGVTTNGGGRFYKKTGGGMVIRQSSGNQTPIIEANNGTLQGTILHTGNIDDLDLPSGITIQGAQPTLNLKDTDTDADDFFIHVNSNKFYVLTDLDDDGASADDTSHHYPLVLDNANKKISSYGGPVLNEHQGFNPYDVVHGYNNSNPDTIRFNFTEMAMELSPPYGGTDTSMGLVFPAFRVNTNTSEKFKLSVQIRSAASTTNGIYIRVYEYDAELPDGKTHISHDASSNAVVQEDTRNASISPTFENQAGDTDWRTKTFTYTPTSTAVWASVVVLNWSGHGTNSLFVRDLKRELDLSAASLNSANQIVLGNDSSGSTPRRLVFASADTGTVTIQADTSSGATYTPSNGRIGSQQIQVGEIIGNTTIDGNLSFAQGHVAQHHNTGTRDKYRVWNSSTYAIGMDDAMTFGSLSNYAMTFQMDNTNAMGWVFLDDAHSDAQGAMSLSTNGKMNIAHSLRIGYGESDTTNAGTNGRLDVSGSIYATSQIIAGRGGGGVALTINDGYGNANVCFNHNGGVPEQNGASGRIEVNTDSSTANNAFMKLQLASAVTAGQSVNPTDVLNIMSNATAAPFRLGLMTTSPEATFHIQSNHAASDVPTIKISEFRPSIHFEDVSTSATDWQILCDHNDISNALQFRSGDSSSENKLSHLEYRMDHSGFHIGNSDGDRQRKLYLHAGTAANDMAELFCSNGNLHIDAETGHHMYLNHYQGNEVRLNYGGGGNGGLKLRTASTGVEITGKLGINVAPSEANLYIDASAGGPGVLVANASSTEGDFAVISGEQIQIGHWDTSTDTYTNRLNINAGGTIFSILPAQTRIQNGSESSPAINFTSDTDTGIFRPTTNTFSIATEGKECVRVDSDQRVLVGDLSDGTLNDQNAMLYVKTEGVQKGLAIRTAGSGTDVISVWSNKIDAGDGVDNDDVHLVAWRVGSGTALRGSIFYDESDNQVDYNRTSDRRLKENIVDIDNAIDVIKQLKPRKFNFNRSAYSHDVKYARANTISGFIADEVQTIIPQAVTGTKDAVYTEDKPEDGAKKGDIIAQQLDVSHLIPHLTKALQEAVTKIETLEAEVAALKAKVG